MKTLLCQEKIGAASHQKEKQDKDNIDTGDMVNGDGYVVTDRNSLLEKLKNMDK